MDIEEIIESLKQNHAKKSPAWKKGYLTLIGLSALLVYGPPVYYKNVFSNLRRFASWQKRLQSILNAIIALVLFVATWPILLVGLMARFLAEKVRSVPMHYALLLATLVVAVAVGIFWINSMPRIILTKIGVAADQQFSSPSTEAVKEGASDSAPNGSAQTKETGKIEGAKISDSVPSPAVPSAQPSPSSAPSETPKPQGDAVVTPENPSANPAPNTISPREAVRASGVFDVNNITTYSYSYYYPTCLKTLGYKEPLSATELDNFPDDLQNCIKLYEATDPDKNR